MDHPRFWALIDAARASSKPSSALVTALAKLPRPAPRAAAVASPATAAGLVRPPLPASFSSTITSSWGCASGHGAARWSSRWGRRITRKPSLVTFSSLISGGSRHLAAPPVMRAVSSANVRKTLEDKFEL